MAPPHVDVDRLFASQAEAMRTKDIDRLMAHYSPDVVYFDVVPPLQYLGADELRGRFQHWFSGYNGPIDLQIRDSKVSATGDLAIGHWFSRASGTLADGRTVGSWVRVTSCCRRTDSGWLITHEHVSLPVDLAAGRALTDLEP